MEILTGLVQAYASAGRPGPMQELFHELDRESHERYVPPCDRARVYAALGDAEQAFSWLHNAYRERNPDLIELRAEPVFDIIRSDPRFADLLRQIGWCN